MFSSLGAIIILGFFGLGCQKEHKKNRSSAKVSSIEEPPPVLNLKGSVGIRNFEQIFETMHVLTKLPANQVLTDAFKTIQGQLPSSNDVTSFSGTNQVAILKLATEFCEEYLKSNDIATQGKEIYVHQFISNFWQYDSADEAKILLELANDLAIESEPGKGVKKSEKLVATGVCVAALSSSVVTFF